MAKSVANDMMILKGHSTFKDVIVENIADIANLCVHHIHNGGILTQSYFDRLNSYQKKIIEIAYNPTTFPINLGDSLLFQKKIKNAILTICKDVYNDPTQYTKINHLVDQSSSIGNVEIMNQLHYFCFFAAISYETSRDSIALLLPYDKDKYKNYDDVVVFYNYETIIFESFKPSFYLFLDEIGSNIILTIRGLENVYETFKTLLHFYEPPKGKKFSAENFHQKLRGVANYVYETVKQKLMFYVEKYPYYNVKIIGHSYGAVIAAYVTWIIQESIRFKKLKLNTSARAILFNCPPLFTEEQCSLSSNFFVCVHFGWNLISSLSLANIYKISCGKHNYKEYFSSKNFSSVVLESIFNMYVPGTNYWLTYDGEKKASDLYLIFKTNERFQNIFLRPEMLEDDDIKMIYTYLLALSKK